jgi:hypothetical protein
MLPSGGILFFYPTHALLVNSFIEFVDVVAILSSFYEITFS